MRSQQAASQVEERGEVLPLEGAGIILQSVQYGPEALRALDTGFPQVPKAIDELGRTIQDAFRAQYRGPEKSYTFEISPRGFFEDLGRDSSVGGGYRIQPDAKWAQITCTEANGVVTVTAIKISIVEKPTAASVTGNA